MSYMLRERVHISLEAIEGNLSYYETFRIYANARPLLRRLLVTYSMVYSTAF